MTRIYWGIGIAVTAGVLVATAAAYPRLPSRLPMHWDIRGQIDGYGPKTWASFLLPGVMLGTLALFAALPILSPRPFEVASFRSTSLYLMVLVLGLFAYLQGLVLLAGLTKFVDVGRALISGIFLFLAAIGNVMGKVRRNFYIGFRTPWTLANERVWDDTHRLASWLLTGAGLLGFLLTALGAPIAAFGLLAIAVVVPAVYSFMLYRRLERSGRA